MARPALLARPAAIDMVEIPIRIPGRSARRTLSTQHPGRLAIVSVRDLTPPVISAPIDQVADATGPTVTYIETATDNSGLSPVVTCAPPSGSVFAIGATTVDCSPTGSSDNTANASFARRRRPTERIRCTMRTMGNRSGGCVVSRLAG
jgi:HYR domain-containing protein